MDTEMLRRLKAYLANTPQEQKIQDWQEIKSMGFKGISARDLITRRKPTHYTYFLLVLAAMCIVGGCSIGYFMYLITSTSSGR